MIRVEVNDTALNERRVPYQGKTLTFFEQFVWAHLFDRNGAPDQHPTKIIISHDKAEDVLQKGVYMLAPGSIYVGKYHTLAIKPRFVKSAVAKAA